MLKGVLFNGAFDSASSIDFVTDNSGVFNSFNRGPKYCSTTSNCDLYRSLFRIIYNKALDCNVRWMPSHLLENPTKGVFSCCSLQDLYGNSAADTLASEAAGDAAKVIPQDIATDIKK